MQKDQKFLDLIEKILLRNTEKAELEFISLEEMKEKRSDDLDKFKTRQKARRETQGRGK